MNEVIPIADKSLHCRTHHHMSGSFVI